MTDNAKVACLESRTLQFQVKRSVLRSVQRQEKLLNSAKMMSCKSAGQDSTTWHTLQMETVQTQVQLNSSLLLAATVALQCLILAFHLDKQRCMGAVYQATALATTSLSPVRPSLNSPASCSSKTVKLATLPALQLQLAATYSANLAPTVSSKVKLVHPKYL